MESAPQTKLSITMFFVIRKRRVGEQTTLRFRQLEPIAESVYQLTFSKKSIKFDHPLQIALMVYHYAKLRMLQFYYDFLDVYIERPLFSIL